MARYAYFGPDYAIKEHDKIIALHGGRLGVIHPELIASAIEFIENDIYYPELEDKLTHLLFSFAQNHCFIDGNKRSAIAISSYFLEVNGFGNLIPTFIVEMENIVLWVAEGLLDKDQLRQLVKDIVQNGSFTESSKLMLLEALEKHNNLSSHE